jgi:E3 ubiquitin-protein ligase MARCH6
MYNHEASRRVRGVVVRVARVLYAYSFLFFAFPFMVSSLMELYAAIPLHELMYSSLLGGDDSSLIASDKASDLNPRHTVRVIQAWTVGLIYLRLGTRIVVDWFPNTRLSAAVRAVLRRGWLDPDLAVLTRAFVVPGVVFWIAAVATPLLFARFAVSHGLAEAMVNAIGGTLADKIPHDQLYDASLVLIHRLCYPFMALSVATTFTLLSIFGVFRSWKVRIRDEAYLIGERLHNFGVNGPPKARGSWRAGGQRL